MDTVISRIGEVLNALNPGYLTLSVIRPALDLFRSETVAPNLSTLMVVTAIALMVMFWFTRVKPAGAALDERIAFLKACRTPGAFYDQIDRFDTLMMAEKYLAHGWSEFIETCLFTRREGKVNVEISIRPAIFINLDDAEHAGLTVRWFRSLSGVFVGVGLLLTFIGLVAALYFSSSAINVVIDSAKEFPAAEQTKAIQRSLAQLLNTATFKFLTSIAGLGSAIVLGFFERRWTASLEQKFQELCSELERCTIIITPEQLANRQHHELCAQTELLKEAPARIGPEIERAFGAALAPVLDKLDEVAHAITTTRQAPMQAMIQEFGATVSASAGREIRAVAETLALLPEQIAAAAEPLALLPHQLSSAAGDLQRSIGALARDLEGVQTRIAPAPPPADDHPLAAVAAELAKAVSALRSDASAAASRPDPAQDAQLAQAAGLPQALTRIEATNRETSGAILSLLDRLQDTASNASHSAAAETGQALSAAMTDATARLQAMLEGALKQQRDGSDQQVNDLATRFLNATKAAQEAAFHQAARIGGALERLGGFLKENAEETSRALAAMTAASERLGTVLEEELRHLRERSDQSAGDLAARVLGATKAAQDASFQLATRIEGAVDCLGALLKDSLAQARQQSDQSGADIAERFLEAARATHETSVALAGRVETAVEKIVSAGLDARHGMGQAAEAAGRTLDARADAAAAELVTGAQLILNQFGATIGPLWRQIDGLTAALEAVERRIATHASALEGTARSARETEAALSGSARALGAAAQPLTTMSEAVAQSMTAIARTVDATVETLKESQHQGQHLSNELRGTLQQLQLIWGQHEGRFAAVDDSLARVLTSIIEHVDAHGAALRDHVVKIDTHLAQTVNNLAGNIEALQETASELTRAVTGVRKLVEALPVAGSERE